MSFPELETAPDFSDPLGLLRACHKRILGFCDLLLKLVDHIETDGVDDEAVSAALAVVRYFSTAGKLHHQDEELDIFPRLEVTSMSLAELINNLKQQHRSQDALWEKLQPLLEQPASIGDMDSFRNLARAFVSSEREHVNRENEQLLGVAARIISDEDQKKIGKAMAERRGVRL